MYGWSTAVVDSALHGSVWKVVYQDRSDDGLNRLRYYPNAHEYLEYFEYMAPAFNLGIIEDSKEDFLCCRGGDNNAGVVRDKSRRQR